MNKLIWQLFEMIRELLPPTRENTERLAKWAHTFKAEGFEDPPPPELELPTSHEELDPEHELELEELENEGGKTSKKKKK